jgi:hypothetical protein
MKVDGKGLATPILPENCMKEMGRDAKGPLDDMPIPSGKGTDEIVQSTGKFWHQPAIFLMRHMNTCSSHGRMDHPHMPDGG